MQFAINIHGHFDEKFSEILKTRRNKNSQFVT